MSDVNTTRKLEMQLDWFHDFVDYVKDMLPNTYDRACEYADKLENERLAEGDDEA